jgi:hypothetical protein
VTGFARSAARDGLGLAEKGGKKSKFRETLQWLCFFNFHFSKIRFRFS